MAMFVKPGLVAMAFFSAMAMSQAEAHHSFAMFDFNKNVTLEGTVKEFQWTNPHVWVQLLVKDATGKEVEWAIEGGSVNNYARGGWTRKSLQPGDRVKIVIHPLRDGSLGGSLSLAFKDGKLIGNPAPDDGPPKGAAQ